MVAMATVQSEERSAIHNRMSDIAQDNIAQGDKMIL